MLLRTRFYLPPLREQAVPRHLLIDRLKHTTGGNLVVLSAPAGYGKTTLASQWLHQCPHTFSWLTLGTEHNAPLRFWEAIITALHQVQPDITLKGLDTAQAQPDADLTPLVIGLLNELDQLSVDNRSREPMTMVWDDFHLIKDTRVLAQCNLLLDHLPPALRVVITTRETPPLALARRRITGQLLWLNIDDLRFNMEESQYFFEHTMALSIPPPVTAALCGRTEGWVAGMQLAGLSLQRIPAVPDKLRVDNLLNDGLLNDDLFNDSVLSGSSINRDIADYLLEEVFTGLTPDVQSFLLHATLPQRFCAALMNTMMARTGTQELLLTLENSHLFLVPLDNHRTWYRFHDLFRQFLLQRAHAASNATTTESVLAALGWFENNGYYNDAIELSLTWSLHHETLRLLQQYQAFDSSAEGHAHIALWATRLPAAWQKKAPFCSEGSPRAEPKSESSSTEIPSTDPLTAQEKRVLDLISQGLSNKAISDRLHISTNTLKVHIRNLYGKMGVETRTQALLKLKSP